MRTKQSEPAKQTLGGAPQYEAQSFHDLDQAIHHKHRKVIVKSESSTLIKSLISSCDELIRAGSILEAQRLLDSTSTRSIPRDQAERLAHVMYRAGLFVEALKVLSPYVRPEGSLNEPATPTERATYAICLIKIGSVQEGIVLLNETRNPVPEVSLYTAFAHQAQWDYQAAIGPLNTYLSSEKITPYSRAVASVNLLAALIYVGNAEASARLFNDLKAQFAAEGWTLLLKNIRDLSVQLALLQNDLNRAKEILLETKSISSSEAGVWDFFLQKWNSVIELRAAGPTPRALAMLEDVRLRAAEIKHWESVRECDYYLATATVDPALLLKVYFGTPHMAYRKRVLSASESWATIPEHFSWQPVAGSSDRLLDLRTGIEAKTGASLKPGQTPHRCLLALHSDLYKPIFIGEMYEKLFPDEYFNPVSAPARVLQAVRRCRKWLDVNKIPINIEADGQFFKPAYSAPYSIRLFSTPLETAKENASLKAYVTQLKLCPTLNDSEFTSDDVAKSLRLSRSSVLRILHEAVEEGHLERRGSGRNTRYKVA